jgi:ankyrin repeat protein
MSDSKELEALCVASQRLIDSDDDRTIKEFCHSIDDVSAFEDALQHCNTHFLTHFLTQSQHFQQAASASAGSGAGAAVTETVILNTSLALDIVHEMKNTLWNLMSSILTRNGFATVSWRGSMSDYASWSADGYSMVTRIAKSILSSSNNSICWLCTDKKWIDKVDDYGNTVFMNAAAYGHTSVIELFLADPRVDKASIDRTNELDWTALMLAASEGHTSVIEVSLADRRVDKTSIDHADEAGDTALICAASGDHASVVKLFLADRRVDKTSIDHANRNGHTALVCAARKGRTSVVELLLADPRVDKASIDHAAEGGWTALMCAAFEGHTSVVELLRADPRVDKDSIDHANAYGWTALTGAGNNGHASVVKLLTNDRRTSWNSIVELMQELHSMRMIRDHKDVEPVLIAELTRRQMCVIYPSRNRQLWPTPDPDPRSVRSDAQCDTKLDRNHALFDAETETETETECALITSFFKFPLFDVNVLGIIREYATYTATYTAMSL